MIENIYAPWTSEQVEALNAFQAEGGMHPFTCGGDHTPASPVLVAKKDGWHCPQPYGENCDYRQDWAPSFMFQRGADLKKSVEAEHDSLGRGADRLRKNWTEMRTRAEAAEVMVEVLMGKLRRARDLHQETCPFAKGSVRPTAFTCSLCEALAECSRCGDTGACNGGPCPLLRSADSSHGGLIQKVVGLIEGRIAELDERSSSNFGEEAYAARELSELAETLRRQVNE